MCCWVQLALNHFFGHVFYALSSVSNEYIARSDLGFEVSGFAILGLTVGVVAHDILLRLTHRSNAKPSHAAIQLSTVNSIGSFALSIGVCFYLIGLSGAYSLLPSSTSVFSASVQLFLGGLCLKWWALWHLGRKRAAWLWVATMLWYPLLTTLGIGFIGMGVAGIITLASYLFSTIRIRWWWAVVSPVVIYFGLSVWVTYAAFRGEFREHVSSDRSLNMRAELFYDGMVNEWKWADFNDPPQLLAIERLDQNIMIGESVRYLESGQGRFGHGETLEEAVTALVPRLFWPDKPVFSGGSGLVSRYTGLRFAEGTSFGIGPVMELYVNFGRPAVLLGFVVFGLFVSTLDRLARVGLERRSLTGFLLPFCVGHVAMNAMNSFAETLPAVIGASLLVYLAHVLYTAYQRMSARLAGAAP